MNPEIERKFLVRDGSWRDGATGCERLRQGYLANTDTCSVRVRVGGGQGWISVKAMRPGRVRDEYEYLIPETEAEAMLAAFVGDPLIDKVRHRVPVAGQVFEVDEFQGANNGLVIAEIELDTADQEFPHPPWLGDEVTDDVRYYNFRLVAEPFASWPEELRQAVSRGCGASGGLR
jgi:adenylate cyclase